MSLDPEFANRLDDAMRALATAGKSLRLYPPASPIPMQAVGAARAYLDGLFEDGRQVLSLAVGRDCFAMGEDEVCKKTLGVDELVRGLQGHGVAELAITPGCTDAELFAFLGTLARSPEEVRDSGGIGAELVAAGVDHIRATNVHLTIAESVVPGEEEDFDEFLRGLARDPEKLGAWFAVAATGDPAAFRESLMELVRVSGPSGFPDMVSALARAFLRQQPEARDALLELSMDPGPTRDLTGAMLAELTSNEIAGSILGGDFGRNMLSLSSALTRLPLERTSAEVRAEVQAMLPGSGHSEKEAAFLEHMIEVRQASSEEPLLADKDATYRSVLEAARLTDEVVEQARGAVTASHRKVTAASVKTILALLDQQTDQELFFSSLMSVARMVPRLLEQGEFVLASEVIAELSRRDALNISPWPGLTEKLQEAMRQAVGLRSMSALLQAAINDPVVLPVAREIVRRGGQPAVESIANEAVKLKGPGLDAAEELLGRRLADQLATIAPKAQWFQLAPIALRLAHEGDSRATQALEALLKRPDEQSRREVVCGLAESSSAAAERLLAQALRDPSPEVAMVAARAMGRSRTPNAAEALGARLSELDIDNSDFTLGREIIAALTRLPGHEADQALDKIASRRALIRRGRFAEVQELVRLAREHRARAGELT